MTLEGYLIIGLAVVVFMLECELSAVTARLREIEKRTR